MEFAIPTPQMCGGAHGYNWGSKEKPLTDEGRREALRMLRFATELDPTFLGYSNNGVTIILELDTQTAFKVEKMMGWL